MQPEQLTKPLQRMSCQWQQPAAAPSGGCMCAPSVKFKRGQAVAFPVRFFFLSFCFLPKIAQTHKYNNTSQETGVRRRGRRRAHEKSAQPNSWRNRIDKFVAGAPKIVAQSTLHFIRLPQNYTKKGAGCDWSSLMWLGLPMGLRLQLGLGLERRLLA